MGTLTRKIKLYPVGDKEEVNRVYQLLRKGIRSQNKAMNMYISTLYVEEMQDVNSDDRKELRRLYGRMPDSKEGSAYTEDNNKFIKGFHTPSNVTHRVGSAFKKSVKDGLLYGKVSLPCYRMDNPLILETANLKVNPSGVRECGFYHTYENHQEFLGHLYEKDLEVIFQPTRDVAFKMILGNPHKSATLRAEIQQIFENYYKIQGSSIQLDGNKIFLNLCMDIPQKNIELDENVIVGCDLGLAVPAVCGLNTDPYRKKFIGSVDDFLKIRTQMQAQYRRIQSNLKFAKGGHGRKTKLKALERFKDRERNFVQNYNHYVSKQVVKFAVDNKAKYINLEYLKGFDSSKFILRNWSFYELQQYITYKANAYGIEVRKINPCYTSQVCSKCGHWEEGQRIDQKHFVCKSCGFEVNADFNASRNIAKCNLFIDEKCENSKLKLINKAREYYGLPISPDEEIMEEKPKKKKKGAVTKSANKSNNDIENLKIDNFVQLKLTT